MCRLPFKTQWVRMRGRVEVFTKLDGAGCKISWTSEKKSGDTHGWAFSGGAFSVVLSGQMLHGVGSVLRFIAAPRTVSLVALLVLAAHPCDQLQRGCPALLPEAAILSAQANQPQPTEP